MIEQTQDISDTVKIERPMCCRRQTDLGGRLAQDSTGNTVTIRTRAYESQNDLSHSLSLFELTDNLPGRT